MSAIPLDDLDEVATKADIALVRSEMAEMRSALKAEITELRSELKIELASEIAALRWSFTNWMLTLLVAIIGAMASISFIS